MMHLELETAISRALNGGLVPTMAGRGIVTSIYDAEFASGWVLLAELVRLGCELPVEVFHMEGELREVQVRLLKSLPLDIRVRKLHVPGFTPRGFQIKPFAIHASEFREVMWIDCDNVPIRDPSFLFTDPEYVQKGSLFWRDVSGADRARFWHPDSVVWKTFGVPYNDSEEFDSGQLLIDKQRCWSELELTLHYNRHADHYYRFVHGDKDTFRMAWWLLHLRRGKGMRQVNALEDPSMVPYGFMPYGPFHIGRVNPWRKWGGGIVMQQRDREGQPLFNHRTMCKWRVDYNANEPLDTPQDAEYRGHLDALRTHLESLRGLLD